MNSLVSVVMSVYDTPEEFLRASISSILEQTYSNFEFIIVNDCSNEATTSILREYEERDPRVRVVANEVNLGLTKNLNRAISLAKGSYVARMDADDLSMPTRLERQVSFLEKHRDISVLGTGYMILENGRLRAPRRHGNQPWQIQGRLFFGCQGILHPSVMFRSEIFTEDGLFYDEEYRIAQDFELWTRIGLRRKIYVLPDALVHYRVSNVQTTTLKRDQQIEYRTKILLKQLGNLGIEPTEEEKTLHIQFAHGKQVCSGSALDAWAQRLLEANNERLLYDPVSFAFNVRKRQLDSSVHILTHRGPTPRNLCDVFHAYRLAAKAKKAFAHESEGRGNPYAS